MTSRTTNSNFLTLLVVPFDMSRTSKMNIVVDTPTLRTVVEGADVRGIRADQILVHRDCDRTSNEFKPWFDQLKYSLTPGSQIVII